jgi:hypothetical protein
LLSLAIGAGADAGCPEAPGFGLCGGHGSLLAAERANLNS